MNDGSNAAIGVSGQELDARLQVRAPLREIEHPAVGRDERQLPDHRQRQVDAVIDRVLEGRSAEGSTISGMARKALAALAPPRPLRAGGAPG